MTIKIEQAVVVAYSLPDATASLVSKTRLLLKVFDLYTERLLNKALFNKMWLGV
ncbi:hypothetical protein GCM10027340_07600 [Marinomonas epiphytica]